MDPRRKLRTDYAMKIRLLIFFHYCILNTGLTIASQLIYPLSYSLRPENKQLGQRIRRSWEKSQIMFPFK
jgi:hypothetical protein